MVAVARWRVGTQTRSGFLEDGHAFALPAEVTTTDLVQQGLPATLELAERTLTGGGAPTPLSDVELLAPIVPASMRDFVAFEEHVEGIAQAMGGGGVVDEWYQAPTFYFTNPHTVLATGETVAIPAGCHELDFETEVAAVVGHVPGSAGRNLTAEQGRDHIFGYTILNDWSARDLQRREMKVSLGPAKGKDFGSTLGPWIVTADELEERYDDEGFLPLGMAVWVNDELIGQDLLSNMGWPFAELVAYASADSRVVPGDVLGSGTCGSGCLAELWGRRGDRTPPPLHPGDRVRMRVEGIGEIVNTVGERREATTLVAARPRPRTRPGVAAWTG